jgi:hypothetical protein
LKHPGRLSSTSKEALTQSLERRHVEPGQRHKTILLEEGMEWAPIGISHEDSQFLESRRFTTEEIARIFGVPPHMIGSDIKDSMTYSNSELESLRLLKYTVGPWLARIESAVNFACVPALERRHLYVEFLSDALLASDTKSRYEAYRIAVDGGASPAGRTSAARASGPRASTCPTAPSGRAALAPRCRTAGSSAEDDLLAIYVAKWRVAVRTAARICGPDAEDVVQTTALYLWQRRDTLPYRIGPGFFINCVKRKAVMATQSSWRRHVTAMDGKNLELVERHNARIAAFASVPEGV